MEQQLPDADKGGETTVDADALTIASAAPAAEESAPAAPAEGTEPPATEKVAEPEESAAPKSEAPVTKKPVEKKKSAEPATESPQKTEAQVVESKAPLAKDEPVAVAGVAGVCDTNINTGKVSTFMQRSDVTTFANGNLSEGLYEGGHVHQRVEFIDIAPGENEFVFKYRVKKDGTWAYDFVDQYSMTGGTITNIQVIPGTGPEREDTVKLTFDATASSVTLLFSAHIASELDHGPGTGASSISGSPYHVTLSTLNCAETGSKDNQISASDVQAGFVTIIKDAVPADGTDFSFLLKSAKTGDSVDFKLDDSANSDSGATDLPDRVKYTVAPGGVTISEGALPAGWNLTNLSCTGVTPTIDLSTHTASFNLADNAEVACTFLNSKTTYTDLEVSKTATPSFDRDYDWTIEKNLADGQEATVKTASEDVVVDYSVLVEASAPKDSNFAVDGVIIVQNDNPAAINGVTLTDSLPGATCAIETAGGTAVTGPISVPNGTTTFNYTCEMPAGTTAATAGTNTITATWDETAYYGTDGEASATTDFTFAGVDPTVTDDSVTVTDNSIDLSVIEGGNLVTVADSPKTFDYSITWPGVVGDCKTYENIATYTEADQDTGSDSASVEVCIGADLAVTKNVKTSFNRSYLWDIVKTPVDGAGPYTTDADGNVTVDYEVTVTPLGYDDSAWAMTGIMYVENPNTWQDVEVTLSDTVDVGGGAACLVTGEVDPGTRTDLDPNTEGFQTVIPSGSTLAFDYSCTFDSKPNYEGVNTAKATWDMVEAATPTGEDTGTAAVTVDAWTQTPYNETVTITDDHHVFEPAWEITWSPELEPQSKTYTVDWNVPDAGQCKDDFRNVATLTGNDGLLDKDDATIEACRPAGLTVDKTVDARFDRTYLWDITKSVVGDTTVNADADGNAVVDYDITVTSKGYADDNRTMSGDITVTNPNRFGGDVEVTVTDTTSLAGLTCVVDAAADVNPGVDGVQVAVPQATEDGGVWIAGTKTVAYNCDTSTVTEADYKDQTNTARIAWDGGSSQRDVAFGFELDGTTDETVQVMDMLVNPDSAAKDLGSVSWSEVTDGDWASWSKTFSDTFTHEATLGECVPFTNKAWVELEGETENPSDEATVTVCDQAGLQVAKTAVGSFDRLYLWEVTKDVDTTEQTIAPDGSAVFNYTVKAIPNGYTDSGETLGGTITLTNPNQFEGGAITATLTDTVDIGGVACEIQATDHDLDTDGLQVLVPANAGTSDGIVIVDYTCSGVPATYTGTNTVDVSWTDATGTEQSAKATAEVTYVLDTEADKTVQVFDDKAGTVGEPVLLGTADWSDGTTGFDSYQLSFPGVEGTCTDYTNTATLTDMAADPRELASATQTVTVCVEQDLDVSKDATATYDRDYDWKIVKQVDETDFNVDGDGNVTANYTVTATQNAHTDSGWEIDGTITVHNPNDFGSITADVTDALNVEGITCTVADGTDVAIAAGATATLAYTCDVAAGVDEARYTGFLKNTATATWGDGRSATSGIVDVDFTLDGTTDASVDVHDDLANPDAEPVKLGTATLGGENVFTYAQELVGTAGKCTTFTNTAVLEEESGSDADNSDSVSVEVCVEKDLTVVKTVEAGFTRDYDWSLDKQVDQSKFTVDGNGKVTANYTVIANLEGHDDQDWTMSGSIDVFNPNQQGALTVDIADAASVPGATCTVAGGGTDVVVPAATVVDGEVVSGKTTVSYDCMIEGELEESDYSGHTNTATVTWTGVDGQDNTASFDAEVLFTQTGSIDETVNVVDDKTVPGSIHELGTVSVGDDEEQRTFTYPVELAGVAGACTTYTNTAVLQESTEHVSDEGTPAISASDNTASTDVEVCAKEGLSVSKTAEASFDREYLWELDKLVDRTQATIGLDGTATFDYTVIATPSGFEDSNHAVSGTITLQNPNQFAEGAITATVTDSLDIQGTTCLIGAEDAEDAVDGLQVEVSAGTDGNPGIVVLDYTCTGTPVNMDYLGENTATATWANAKGEEISATGTARVAYAEAGSTNPDLEVFDDKAGTVEAPVSLGTADWNSDGVPTEFTYQVIFTNPNPDALHGTCTTYTNTATSVATDDAGTSVEVCVEVGAPTVEKTVTDTRQNADGTWNITYTLEVANNDEVQGRYSLDDTLSFGAGITLTDASWTGPVAGDGDAWDLETPQYTEVLATNKLINAGTTEAYQVTVTADVAAGATGTEAGNCELVEGEEGTGFLNTATITANGQDTEVTACAAPVAPVFDKQALGLVQHEDADGNWDGTWDASYKLIVTNRGTDGASANYTLTDTPAFAAGVTVNDRHVGSTDVVVNEAWHGGNSTDDVVAANQVLESGAVHTFTVIVNVTLTSAINDADRVCGEDGHGLLNTGVLTAGNDSDTDTACLEIPAPGSNVVKTAVTAEENADGSWDAHYTVVVNNTSDVATRYNLTDTLRFGEGITATSANWTLEGTDTAGSWENPGSDPATVLATDRNLEARDSHTYLVHVVAVLADGVIGSKAGTCQPEDTNTDGGFLNEATLSANGKTTASRDCETPVKNPRGYSLVKSSDPASGTIVWPGDTIGYTLTVRNTGEFVYTGAVVTDEMAGWQHAATFKEGSLRLSGGESVIEGSKLVWTVGELAVGEEKTLTYSITVDDGAWDEVLVNVATGNGDVPPSKTVHPTPEKTVTPPAPPAVVVPPRKPVTTLATTGADDSTLWILGSGALLLLLGAAFTAASRRRNGEGN